MKKQFIFLKEQGALPKTLSENEKKRFKDKFFKGKTLAFVGKCSFDEGRTVVYSCPKYMDEITVNKANLPEENAERQTARETITSHINTIINVLIKLEKDDNYIDSENVFAIGSLQDNSAVVERLSVAEFLLRDYLNHGLYYESSHITGNQSRGRISWSRTIQKTRPYISDDNVIYTDLIRKYKISDFSQFITRIHASALRYAYDLIQNTGKYKSLILPDDIDMISADDLKKTVPIVRKYLRCAVSNRDIFLFRTLEAWCGKSKHYDNVTFGTTAFDRVWEYTNDHVFGYCNVSKNSSPPEYSFFGEEKTETYKGAGEAKIDTLYIDDNTAAVFDSKYYVIKSVHGSKIEGYPANADISKQVGYLNEIKKAYVKQNYCNAFLLPAFTLNYLISKKLPENFNELASENWNGLFNIAGKVCRGAFPSDNRSNRNNTPVLLIHIKPELLYDRLLNNKKITKEEIRVISDKCSDALKSSIPCLKFLFASDSFKGSLTSAQTIELLTKAAGEVFPNCECLGVPVADGGEGTVNAVVSATNGKRVTAEVHDPLMNTIKAAYGITDGNKAIIEMSAASGLPLVPEHLRDPMNTTTYGTGELILDALDRGCRDISAAIGGSATNDGGIGCMRALGIRFLDKDGHELSGFGRDLAEVTHIDASGLDRRLSECRITVMCDVKNPLCGINGASRTFAGQKGASDEIIDQLESGMCNYRDVIKKEFGIDCDTVEGSGAAGGLGAALNVFLGGKMQSGIETVLQLIDFDEKLKGADIVITGEGCTDSQSVGGKVMQGVGIHAKRLGIPCIGLSGSLGEGAERILDYGISSLRCVVDRPMPLEYAMTNAEALYYNAAVRMFRSIKTGMKLS